MRCGRCLPVTRGCTPLLLEPSVPSPFCPVQRFLLLPCGTLTRDRAKKNRCAVSVAVTEQCPVWSSTRCSALPLPSESWRLTEKEGRLMYTELQCAVERDSKGPSPWTGLEEGGRFLNLVSG